MYLPGYALTDEELDGVRRKPKVMWYSHYHLQGRAYEAEQRFNAGFLVMARPLVKLERLQS
jgi:hypothetical protein